MNNTLCHRFGVNGIDYKNLKWQGSAQANSEMCLLPHCSIKRTRTLLLKFMNYPRLPVKD